MGKNGPVQNTFDKLIKKPILFEALTEKWNVFPSEYAHIVTMATVQCLAWKLLHYRLQRAFKIMKKVSTFLKGQHD